MTNENVQDFINKCLDDNSISELENLIALGEVDTIDCDTWKLTPYEWTYAISEALQIKKSWNNQ